MTLSTATDGLYFDHSVRFTPHPLFVAATESANRLEELLPGLRELSGKKDRTNDPVTVAIAGVIVALRDAVEGGR